MNRSSTKAALLLDDANQMLAHGAVGDGMDFLVKGLDQLKRQNSDHEWDSVSAVQCPAHPILRLLQQDPFTRHSFQRPRGYPGDAELIDFVYGHNDVPETGALGSDIYKYTVNSAVPQSIRARREVLAGAIDAAAVNTPFPRVISIGSGHARELDMSLAARNGKVGEFIAVDSDKWSLSRLESERRVPNLTTVPASVGNLLSGEIQFSDLDFVYAAGIFDHLLQPFATKLTSIMFAMLKSGGRMLVTNFSPDTADSAYMEAFMRWPLICRDEYSLDGLSRNVLPAEILSKNCFRDMHRNLVFLDIRKL